jgi:hypothetical protein
MWNILRRGKNVFRGSYVSYQTAIRTVIATGSSSIRHMHPEVLTKKRWNFFCRFYLFSSLLLFLLGCFINSFPSSWFSFIFCSPYYFSFLFPILFCTLDLFSYFSFFVVTVIVFVFGRLTATITFTCRPHELPFTSFSDLTGTETQITYALGFSTTPIVRLRSLQSAQNWCRHS